VFPSTSTGPHGVTGKGAPGRIVVDKSLGRVSNGWLADGNREAVAGNIRPHVEAFGFVAGRGRSVTGLIDWELSTPKPFGVDFGRIHTLAGEFTGGEL
jgi:hypothetical protein